MTDERLAEIRARHEAGYPGGTEPEPWGGFPQMMADMEALLADNDRLRGEIICARNFLVLGEANHADRHLRDAVSND